jgi:hypothetical protein
MRSGLDCQINLWRQRFNRSIEHRKKLANLLIPLWPNQGRCLGSGNGNRLGLWDRGETPCAAIARTREYGVCHANESQAGHTRWPRFW